jgi:hypothetical protein
LSSDSATKNVEKCGLHIFLPASQSATYIEANFNAEAANSTVVTPM